MEVESRMTIDAAAVVIFLRPAAMAEQRAEAGGHEGPEWPRGAWMATRGRWHLTCCLLDVD